MDSGITYTWEFSTNNFTNFSTLNTPGPQITLTAPMPATQYRLKVSCENSGLSHTSNSVLVYVPVCYTWFTSIKEPNSNVVHFKGFPAGGQFKWFFGDGVVTDYIAADT